MKEKIFRLHDRAQLKEGVSKEELQDAIAQCVENIRRAQRQGRMLTAALYQADRMLFLYYEAIGTKLSVTEPIKAQNAKEEVLESGEDVQLNCLYPDEFLAPLSKYLQVWPGQQDDRLWVHMYYIYCHQYPQSVEQWRRTQIPTRRRGRIAFLRDEMLFSYVYHHKAIVEEGLLTGDKYQSIALHENILFSYFEEPKNMVNIKGDYETGSEAIKEWIAVNPEAHFIHMPQGEGENFMFLPALFALGVEDLERDE